MPVPESVVEVLRLHKVQQAERRLALGIGRDENGFVFPHHFTAELQDPRSFSRTFSAEAKAAGLKGITFHCLRHTHITHLLLKGVPVKTVQHRAGHATATTTLDTYGHLLPGEQESAADIFDATLKAALDKG